MFCSACGHQAAPGSTFCTQCGKPLAAAGNQSTVSLDKAGPPPMVRPGQLGDEGLPPGVAGWSWGAFLLNWIWAIGNRTWIGLLALVPYVGLGVAIWLGIKGREMAWKAREWESVEHFNRVQRSWSRWAVGLTLGLIVFGFLAALVVPAYQSYVDRAHAVAGASVDESLVPGARVESGPIDSNDNALPATLVTSAGTLERTGTAGGLRRVTLGGKRLFDGEDAQWQFPVRSFSLSNGREAVLMASSGGRGNSCETLFFFLLIDGAKVQPTPLFGTCAPEGSYHQRGDQVTLELPKMGGTAQIVLRDGDVIEDGRTITLDNLNDPAK